MPSSADSHDTNALGPPVGSAECRSGAPRAAGRPQADYDPRLSSINGRRCVGFSFNTTRRASRASTDPTRLPPGRVVPRLHVSRGNACRYPLADGSSGRVREYGEPSPFGWGQAGPDAGNVRMIDSEDEAIETASTAGADRADQRHVLMADREPVRVGMVAAQRIVLPGPVVEGPIRRRHDGAPGWVTIHADEGESRPATGPGAIARHFLPRFRL